MSEVSPSLKISVKSPPVAVEGTRPARRRGENHAALFPIPRYYLHGHRREDYREFRSQLAGTRTDPYPLARTPLSRVPHTSPVLCDHALTSVATGKPRAPLLRKEGGRGAIEVRGGKGGSGARGRSFIGRRPDATGVNGHVVSHSYLMGGGIERMG